MGAVDYSKYGAEPDIDYSKYGADFEELLNRSDNPTKEIKSFAQNFNDAILGAGDAINTFPAKIANAFSPESMQAPIPKSGEGTAYGVGKLAGEAANYAAGSGLFKAGLKGLEYVPALNKVAKSLGGTGFGGVAGRTLGAAGYGAIEKPDNRAKGAGEMAALSLAIDTIFGGIKGLNGLKPSQMFRGNLTPEKLQRNLEVTKGTNTGLGNVIESPYLQRLLDNRLSNAAGSTAEAITANTATDLEKRGEKILGNYLGATEPSNVEKKLGEALKNAYEDQKNLKNDLYQDAYEIAQKNNFSLNFNSFFEKAKKHGDLLSSQGFLEGNPEVKKQINKIIDVSKPKEIKNSLEERLSGKAPTDMKTGKLPDLQESNKFAGELVSLSKKLKSSPLPSDRNASGILGELGRSLKSDIRSSIDSHGNKELMKSYQDAEKNYAKNFSPFLDEDVYQFIGGNESAENIISTFIKTGKNTDKGEHLSKLMSKLSPEDQNLAKYAYFSRAKEGTESDPFLNPNSLAGLWSKRNLGENQKKALIPDIKERKALDDYHKLVGMNKESLQRMFNPKTGQRNAEHLDSTINLGLGLAGMSLGGATGAIGALAGKHKLKEFLTKKLTSQETRERMVNKMIKGDKNRGMILNALRMISKPVIGQAFLGE